jgi:hypothetical protein
MVKNFIYNFKADVDEADLASFKDKIDQLYKSVLQLDN